MIFTRSSLFTKYCACALATMLAFQPLGLYAAAITTSSLAEAPLQGANLAKPNIMFTMDDSTSMGLTRLPDYIEALFGCRNPDGSAGQCNPPPPPSGGVPGSPAHPIWRSKDVNHIYYDPAAIYDVGVASDNTPLPYGPTNSPTSVYDDGFAGYPGTNTGGTVDLTTGFADEVFCWRATTDPADLGTARLDSANPGSVCRYNGVAYPSATVGGVTTSGVSAGYNYPNAATTSCSNTATTACVFDQRVVVTGSPYYYTIANVMFCPAPADPKGWGVLSSSCSTHWSDINHFVSYGSGGFDPSAFKRVTISATDTAQMTNFARWYAFNRTRILAMKTAGGIAFSHVDASVRIGFNTFANYPTNFLNVADFTPAYKQTWFTNFYAAQLSDGADFVGNTPTFDAMWRIGQYFAGLPTTLAAEGVRPALPGLPNQQDPLDPVTGKCQLNYHLLATDGYQNQFRGRTYPGVGSDLIGDEDGVVPNLPNLPGNTGFTPGQPFPWPYGEGVTATVRTLADAAMYYWIHDLRPTLDDLVKGNAPWQHVNFYALAIGAEGTLNYPNLDPSTPWPIPFSISSTFLGATDLVPPNATTIDDLWHAALNGHGRYTNAQTPRQIAEGILNALFDVQVVPGTGSAVGLAAAQLTATTSFGYLTSWGVDWSGDVLKYALDPNTGALPVNASGNPLNPAVWSAQTQLDIQAGGTGWNLNRRIVTIADTPTGGGVAFRAANLSSAQLTSLTLGWSNAGVLPVPSGDSIVNFLRGDKSNEGTNPTNFRVRTHFLGDIVASAAVPVGAPNRPYEEAGNPGYTAFASTNKNRTPAVYVGANDGMLHAFDDSNTANAGKETWAYVPKATFFGSDPNDSTHAPNPDFSLGALSYRIGGLPLFAHRFYVNATPRIWDIDFANTRTSTPPQSGNDWRTLLVGGLGAGGRSVYALDVTTPVALTDLEATVASSGRVLWEYTDSNLGYVFDAPTLVKTAAYGWVVLVASGYNNPGGQGFLYVLNPTDGALLQKLFLPGDTGNDSNPTGLSTIRAFTASRKDPYVLQAYGGDLQGNIWRFDLSDPDPTKWQNGVKRIAQLTDGTRRQPITTGVRIEIDQTTNSSDPPRYLFVGTGKLLDQQDLTDPLAPRNTLYVIRDGTRSTPDPAPVTPYSRSDLNSVDITSTQRFTGTATGRGWFMDASDPAQKIVTDVTADVQTVVAVFSKQSDDPCGVTLASTLVARDYGTGQSVLESTGGTVVPSISNVGAIAGVTLIQGQFGASGDVPGGGVRVQVTTMAGQVFSFGVNLTIPVNNKHRVSWRLVNRD